MRYLPPPAVFFIIVISMACLPKWGEYTAPFMLIVLPLILALWLAVASLWQFYQDKANVDPRNLDKTQRLVCRGVYRISRNPMYLSLALCLSVWAMWLGHCLAWSGVILFIYWMTRYQIRREEAFLLMKFGEDYRTYQRKVRRWI